MSEELAEEIVLGSGVFVRMTEDKLLMARSPISTNNTAFIL